MLITMEVGMLVRPFCWDDIEGYAEVMADGRPPYSAELAREYLCQPNLSPERDCFVVDEDGNLWGFVLVVPEISVGRTIIEGRVRQSARGRGYGRVLLSKALGHSRTLGARIAHASARPEEKDVIRLFSVAGFADVKRQWQMRLEMTECRFKEVNASYTVSVMTPGEESIMTDLQNKAFSGSWGFAPNVPEEIAYRLRMDGATPSDVLLLREGHDPAAYCWTRLEQESNGRLLGIIWMIGSDPGKRGLGLGRAMINEAIRSLMDRGAQSVELTVYADNEPAVRLYESVGFRHRHDIIWYEKAL